jgi:hypothetical protein
LGWRRASIMHSRRYHCLSCFLPWLLMFFFSLSLSLKGGNEVTFFLLRWGVWLCVCRAQGKQVPRPLASFGGAVQTPRSDSPAGEAGGSWRALPTLLPLLFLPKPPPSNSECFESFHFYIMWIDLNPLASLARSLHWQALPRDIPTRIPSHRFRTFAFSLLFFAFSLYLSLQWGRERRGDSRTRFYSF